MKNINVQLSLSHLKCNIIKKKYIIYYFMQSLFYSQKLYIKNNKKN